MKLTIDLIDEFIENLKAQGKSEHTITAYKIDLKQAFEFFRSLGRETIEDIAHNDIYKYIEYLENERGLNIRTAVRKLVVIKTFFNYLIAKGKLEKMKSPLLGFSLPHLEEKPPRYLKPMEYLALREASRNDPRLYAIFEVLLQTGIRVGELTRLRVGDLKFTPKGRPYLYISKYGSNDSRIVPLPKPAYKALQTYLKKVRPKLPKDQDSGYLFITRTGRPIPVRNIREMIKRLMTNVGIEDATVNDLRNTFIVHQLRNGVDLVTLAKVVGHKRLSTTERYLKLVRQEKSKEKATDVLGDVATI